MTNKFQDINKGISAQNMSPIPSANHHRVVNSISQSSHDRLRVETWSSSGEDNSGELQLDYEDESPDSVMESGDESDIIEMQEVINEQQNTNAIHCGSQKFGQKDNPYKEALKFIEELKFPKVYIGRIRRFGVDWRIQRKGYMTPQEKELFDYTNKILQHPSCILKGEKLKTKTRDNYSYSIARYLVFMAKKNVGIEQFTIDGILLTENMREYVDERDREGKTGDFSKSIEAFQNALAFLRHCIALYECRNIRDERAALHKVRQLRAIPNLDYLTEFASERRRNHREIPREDIHDDQKNVYTNETYSIENLKVMMINMYNLTGKEGKKNIYDGINSVLEILMGHHLLYRGKNKRVAELSDISFTDHDSDRGVVPLLTFTTKIGEGITENSKPHSMGACRNKDVEICLVTAIAMSIWYRFDLTGDREPLSGIKRAYFLDKKEWFPTKILFADSPTSRSNKPISSKYETSLVKLCCKSIGAVLNKRLQPGTQEGLGKLDANQVEMSQIRKAGGCAEDIIEGRYLDSHQLEFIFTSGGFDLAESYSCVRDIEPSEYLQEKIFPWLDSVIKAVKARDKKQEQAAQITTDKDTDTAKFLQMLKIFRKVILQDLTVLADRAPNSVFAKHPITKDLEFIRFKEKVKGIQVGGVPNNLTPAFMKKVEEVQNSINQVQSSLLNRFEPKIDRLERSSAAVSTSYYHELADKIKDAVANQLCEAINDRNYNDEAREDDAMSRVQKLESQLEAMSQLIGRLVTKQDEICEKLTRLNDS